MQPRGQCTQTPDCLIVFELQNDLYPLQGHSPDSPAVTHAPGLSTAYDNSGAIFSRVSKWTKSPNVGRNLCLFASNRAYVRQPLHITAHWTMCLCGTNGGY